MRTAVVLGMLLLAFGTPLLGQEAIPVGIGDRVRIQTTQGSAHDGWVRAVSATAFDLERLEGGEMISVPSTDVRNLQVYQGKKRVPMQGLLLGMVGGAAVGAVMGAMSDACSEISCGRGDNAKVGALVMGILGIPVGLIAGMIIKVDRWEPGVWSPEFQVSAIGGRGMSVGISLRVPGWH